MLRSISMRGPYIAGKDGDARGRCEEMRVSTLGAPPRRPEPETPDQPAERPDDQPVDREAAPRRRIREEDPRLRLEPRAASLLERAQIHAHLRVSRLLEAGEVLDGEETSGRRPRPPDCDQRLRIVQPKATGGPASRTRAAGRRPRRARGAGR